MSQETWACFILEATNDDVKAVLPDYDIDALYNRMASIVCGEVTDDHGLEDCFEYFDDDSQEVDGLLEEYRKFQKLFHDATGIRIYFGSHDSDNSGNRGDDLNGHFWHVHFNDVYDLTPDAMVIRATRGVKFQWRHYTIWG